jgi:hypothetical protein
VSWPIGPALNPSRNGTQILWTIPVLWTHQNRPPNRAWTLNALSRTPECGIVPESLAYDLEQILR